MIPRPLVPASLIPFLDPWCWWGAALVAVLVVVALRWQAPDWRQLRGLLVRVAVGLLGIGVLLELQRRGGIGAPVRSWASLLLWAAASAAFAHGTVTLLDRALRSTSGRHRPDHEEPEP